MSTIAGIVLLLLGVVFTAAGRVCFRHMFLLLEPTDSSGNELKRWLEESNTVQRIAVAFMHRAIMKTYSAIAASQDCLERTAGVPNLAYDIGLKRATIAVIFRWSLLPVVIGLGLILSERLWLLLAFPLAWLLSIVPFFPFLIAMQLLCVVSGWIYGGLVYRLFSSGSGIWYYISSGTGVLCMALVYTVIMVITARRK